MSRTPESLSYTPQVFESPADNGPLINGEQLLGDDSHNLTSIVENLVYEKLCLQKQVKHLQQAVLDTQVKHLDSLSNKSLSTGGHFRGNMIVNAYNKHTIVNQINSGSTLSHSSSSNLLLPPANNNFLSSSGSNTNLHFTMQKAGYDRNRGNHDRNRGNDDLTITQDDYDDLKREKKELGKELDRKVCENNELKNKLETVELELRFMKASQKHVNNQNPISVQNIPHSEEESVGQTTPSHVLGNATPMGIRTPTIHEKNLSPIILSSRFENPVPNRTSSLNLSVNTRASTKDISMSSNDDGVRSKHQSDAEESHHGGRYQGTSSSSYHGCSYHSSQHGGITMENSSARIMVSTETGRMNSARSERERRMRDMPEYQTILDYFCKKIGVDQRHEDKNKAFQLWRLQVSNAVLIRNVEELELKNDTILGTLGKTTQELSKAKSEIEKSEQKYLELECTTRGLETDYSNLETKLQKKDGQIQQLKEEIHALKKSLENSEKHVQDRDEQLVVQEKEIQELKQTHEKAILNIENQHNEIVKTKDRKLESVKEQLSAEFEKEKQSAILKMEKKHEIQLSDFHAKKIKAEEECSDMERKYLENKLMNEKFERENKYLTKELDEIRKRFTDLNKILDSTGGTDAEKKRIIREQTLLKEITELKKENEKLLADRGCTIERDTNNLEAGEKEARTTNTGKDKPSDSEKKDNKPPGSVTMKRIGKSESKPLVKR